MLTERLAVAWAAGLLARGGDAAVADAFIASRIGGQWGSLFGTLAPNRSLEHIARRAVPAN
jgi:putative acyl-CoA dehydrogenase